MFTKIYWIHQFENSARLGIMARPRGGDSLSGEIINLKKQNVGLLVSLLEREEIFELGLHMEQSISNMNGIEFFNFPIVDRSLPKESDKINWLINYLKNKLADGLDIIIHCRMGIGRSTIIAAAVLSETGLNVDTVIENISKIRGIKVPDTDDQLQWIKNKIWQKQSNRY